MNLICILGTNIKVLRQATRQSQADLSQRSRVARSYLARMESGTCNPSLRTIQQIADALNVDPVLLLLEKGSSGPRTPAEELALAAFKEPTLVEWTSEGLRLQAIHPKSDLAIRVLSHLISEGYRGDRLRRKYREIYLSIRAFFPDTTFLD